MNIYSGADPDNLKRGWCSGIKRKFHQKIGQFWSNFRQFLRNFYKCSHKKRNSDPLNAALDLPMQFNFICVATELSINQHIFLERFGRLPITVENIWCDIVAHVGMYQYVSFNSQFAIMWRIFCHIFFTIVSIFMT